MIRMHAVRPSHVRRTLAMPHTSRTYNLQQADLLHLSGRTVHPASNYKIVHRCRSLPYEIVREITSRPRMRPTVDLSVSARAAAQWLAKSRPARRPPTCHCTHARTWRMRRHRASRC